VGGGERAKTHIPPNEIKLKSLPEINFAHHQLTRNICVGRFTLMMAIITSEKGSICAERFLSAGPAFGQEMKPSPISAFASRVGQLTAH